MAEKLPYYAHKPRIFILSDITNEPDDSQSFCRYLTYANQFDTEGVVATTSTWLRRRVAPEALLDIVDGYEQVVENLNAHAHPDSPYPSADYIRSIIKPGAPVYGMEAIGDDIPLSPGAQLLLARLLSPDPRPLWILVWGGTNVLASVIYHIRHRLNAAQLRAKLRIYTIGDQDDTGAWMRQQWPDLFYICSVHGWNNYGSAGWIGISVDLPQDVGGPDPSMVSRDWIRKNIQIGPLGAKYPDVQYGMEGDTPTFLYHIQNGLGVSEEPSWGSWGGRWLSVNVSSKGLPKGHRADACDEVVGMNGVKHYSPRAAIWRWRNAFQADFQARIQWTLTRDFAACNHAPVVCVNGDKSLAPLYIDVDAGSSVVLDASASYDPDGDALEYKWWQYKEPSAILSYHSFEVVDLRIEPSSDSPSVVQVHVPGPDTSCTIKKELKLYDHDVVLEKGSPLHVILEVKDNGSPALTTYRRVVITPVNREFKQKL